MCARHCGSVFSKQLLADLLVRCLLCHSAPFIRGRRSSRYRFSNPMITQVRQACGPGQVRKGWR